MTLCSLPINLLVNPGRYLLCLLLSRLQYTGPIGRYLYYNFMLLTVHAILMRQAFQIQEYLRVHFVGTYAYIIT